MHLFSFLLFVKQYENNKNSNINFDFNLWVLSPDCLFKSNW